MVEDMQSIGLDDLMVAARVGQWDVVDENLSVLAIKEEVIKWSWVGVDDEDDNIRDLAVSAIEQSKQLLTEEQKEKLKSLMSGDTNPFVQYRSAFALFNRGDRSEEVVAKIREAATNEDVREIAENYLSQLM